MQMTSVPFSCRLENGFDLNSWWEGAISLGLSKADIAQNKHTSGCLLH